MSFFAWLRRVTRRRRAILIHGLTSDKHTWFRVEETLRRRGYRVTSVNLSGHGDAVRHEEYSFAGWVDEVLAQAGGRRVDLIVGHSLGGLIAAGVAHRAGADRILLLDPLLHVPANTVQWLAKSVIQNSPMLNESLLRLQFPQWSLEAVKFELAAIRAWDKNTMKAMIPEEGQVIADGFLADPKRGQILILKPRYSFLLPTRHAIQLAHQGLDVLEVPGAAHSVHHDQPELLLRILDRFAA
jgi:pimeloyl-ACP methyl ester carboxylesterase